jgi:hypothetical protein
MSTPSKDLFLMILNQYKKPVIIFVIGLVSIFCIIFAFNSFGKDYVTEIIQDLVKGHMKLIEEQYAEEMKVRDAQINNLQNRLSNSEKTYANLKKRVGDVETKIKERKPPATSGELRDRFNQLDYKPVN